jgi:CSLREA domain-containing protein
MLNSKFKVEIRFVANSFFLTFIFLLLFSGLQAATFTVDSTLDSSDAAPGDGVCSDGGVCTLRAAIQEANALLGADFIVFNIAGTGVQTIAPFSPLPEITAPLSIDGFSQPGASPNTNPTTQGLNAVLLIELSGQNAGAGADGIRITGGSSVVRGLVINRFSDDGIAVNDGDQNTVIGNYIGTDPTGMIDLGNGFDGISFNVRANDLIGGANPGEGNLISGNDSDGISVGNSNTLQILGNLIGTQADGITPLGNGAHGIFFFATGATTTVGVTAPNTIAFNGGDGVFDSSGTGNRIARNSIHSNGGLGIDLGANGVTPNDAGDADPGPNNLQNFPVLTSAINSGMSVSFNGSLNSTAGADFTLDFYAVAACDAAGSGEGQIHIGSAAVTTDAAGNAAFAQTFLAAIPAAYRFTATATDAANNTSEFSTCSFVPTAAVVSIGGRVLTGDGMFLPNASVLLTDQNGLTRQTKSNSFGFYQFNDVPAGEIYVISGSHKAFQFVPQTVFIHDARDDLNLVGF